MKGKKRFLLLVVAMMFSVIFTGCQKDEISDSDGLEEDQQANIEVEEDNEDILDLSDWNGTWNNITPYLDEEEVQGAYEELADRENTSKQAAKENFK